MTDAGHQDDTARASRQAPPVHAGQSGAYPPGLLAEAPLTRPLPLVPAAGGRPAVFIDKDGTLIENVPYNADPALLRFMPAAFEALAALQAAGFALVVVSNQSGLALGRFTQQQFERLRGVLVQRLRSEAGIELVDFLFCPHAPGADALPVCACRKPEPGMLLEAAARHRLDLSRSWMVGDTLDDVEAAHRAGCHAMLYDSGGETLWRQSPLRKPDVRVDDWDDVAHAILSGMSGPLESTATALPVA